MKHKQIIEAHHRALSEASGKHEEVGHVIGIQIDIKPIVTWQQVARMRDGSARKIATGAPPNTPEFRPVEVKESNRCCVVM